MAFSLKNLTVFLWIKFFSTWVTEKKSSTTRLNAKEFCLNIMCQSHQIVMNKFLKSPCLDNRFEHTLNQYPSFVKQTVPNFPPFTCYSTPARPAFFTKICSSCIPQYPMFFTNCKILPTIPNILHKVQNLAAIPPLTPTQDLPKERCAFAIPHNTQHSSQMVQGLVAIPHHYGILQILQNPCCYSTATTPDILHQKPHSHSNNTQYCCYSTPSLQFWQYPIFFTDCKTLLLFHQHSIQDLTQQRYDISAYRKDIHFAQNCHQVSYDVAVVFLLSETNYSIVRYERIELTRSCIVGRVNKGDAYINENSSFASRMK